MLRISMISEYIFLELTLNSQSIFLQYNLTAFEYYTPSFKRSFNKCINKLIEFQKFNILDYTQFYK